jgi:hypothetical protein
MENIMTQQITIVADTAAALKPLIESAIKTELRVLELGIERTHQHLMAFEERYGMTSPEFEQRFNKREVAESLDFIEWWGEIKTHRLLASQQQTLAGARLN